MIRTLILTVVAAFLVVSGGILWSASAATPSAVLRISPSSGTISVGGTLAVDVLLDSGGQGVSYVLGELTFSDSLEFVSASTADSVMPSVVVAPTANGQTIRFELTRTNDDGYKGNGGLVTKLRFKSKSEGKVDLIFNQANSQVLAFEDSSNILKSVGNGNYTVANTPSSTTTTATPSSKSTSTTTTKSSSKTAQSTTVKASPTPTPSSIPVAAIESFSPEPIATFEPSPIASPTIPVVVPDIDVETGTPVASLASKLILNTLAILGGFALLLLLAYLIMQYLKKRKQAAAMQYRQPVVSAPGVRPPVAQQPMVQQPVARPQQQPQSPQQQPPQQWQ